MIRASAAVIPLHKWEESDTGKLEDIYNMVSIYPVDAKEYSFIESLFSLAYDKLGAPTGSTALYLIFHYGRIMGKREERKRRRSATESRRRRLMDALKSMSSDT